MLKDTEPAARRQIQDEIRQWLGGATEVAAAWIFGSFADGRPFEDIDIGVLVRPGTSVDPGFLDRLAGELEKVTGQPRLEVDLKDLGGAPCHFQHEVLKKGRLLFCRDDVTRIRFECEVLSRYLDYKPVRRFFTDALLRRIPEAGHGG